MWHSWMNMVDSHGQWTRGVICQRQSNMSAWAQANLWPKFESTPWLVARDISHPISYFCLPTCRRPLFKTAYDAVPNHVIGVRS